MTQMIIVLLLLYGIPSVIGILLLRYILLNVWTRKGANITSVSLLLTGIITLTVFLINDNLSRKHSSTIEICQNIFLKVDSVEQDHFLDWSVKFSGEIYNKIDSHEFKFNNGNGPYLEFTLDSSYLIISTYSPTKTQLKRIKFSNVRCDFPRVFRMNENFEIYEK